MHGLPADAKLAADRVEAQARFAQRSDLAAAVAFRVSALPSHRSTPDPTIQHIVPAAA
jgi:hypothetical protein